MRLFTCSIILALLLPLSGALSEELLVGSEFEGPKSPVDTEAIEDKRNENFEQALQLIRSGKEGEASKLLETIRKEAFSLEYVNLPEYSEQLINLAVAKQSAGDYATAGFLARWAEKLSSEHSGIHFALSGLKETLGFNQATKHYIAGIKYLPGSPLALTKVIANTVIVLLVAMTVSLIVVCIVQLFKNSEIIVQRFRNNISPNWRGYVTFPALLILLLYPISIGPLGLVLVWSFVLSANVKSCRYLALVASLIVLAWPVLLAPALRLSLESFDVVNRAVESVNSRGYGNLDKMALEVAKDSDLDSLSLQFAWAQTLRRAGSFNEAAEVFQNIIEVTPKDSEIHKKAVINLAGIFYSQRDYNTADATLSSLEGKENSFEYFYNYAHIKLELLDSASYRAYLKKALDIDEGRMDWLSQYQVGSGRQIFAVLPGSEIYFRYLSHSKAYENEVQKRASKVFSSLIIQGSRGFLLVLGIVSLLVSIQLIGMSPKTELAGASQFGNQLSRLWYSLPAGGFVAGSRPAIGFVLLSVLLALLFLAVNEPVQLMSLSVGPAKSSSPFMALFGLAFISLAIFSVSTHKKEALNANV